MRCCSPRYEPSLRPSGSVGLYFDLGFLLAGFPSPGSDRGMAQGAHAGLGADILSGQSIMWNREQPRVVCSGNTPRECLSAPGRCQHQPEG